MPASSIEDYAAIGNCRTLALVSRTGSIDWWCFPSFGSPSVFGALLDDERGGRFALELESARTAGQRYEPGTNVLRTVLQGAGGEAEIVDWMDVPHPDEQAPQEIVRIARCTAGEVRLRCVFAPRPGYATRPAGLRPAGPGCWSWDANGVPARLLTGAALQLRDDGTLQGTCTLRAGEQQVFLLRTGEPFAGPAPDALAAHAAGRLDEALGWWRDWSSRCATVGPAPDAVRRSALALKLLTDRPTGAVLAAATTSLPESESGRRNWDYRYCWIRDSSLVMQSFVDLGYEHESDAFLRWLLHATARTRPRLQVVYDENGNTELPERELGHLRGYHGIGPVRIGNGAALQVQHDVYGEVLATAAHLVRAGGRLDAREKELLAGFAQVVCEIWREPDHGIWEIRLPRRHNTHSKLMCWTALDRALALHRDVGLPIDAEHVGRERDAIRRDIDANAFDTRIDSYVGFYGSDDVDASLLLMPRVGYLPAGHPRVAGTVDRILQQLRVDGMLYRYPPGGAYDGVEGPEHLFAICSFWAVECLARQGRLDEAHRMFERVLRLRTPAGLYAEEFRAGDGAPMGNFPQAFSHVGLITAALALQAAG